MTIGQIACTVCGNDTPHYHSPDEVRIEREIRPVFERWVKDKTPPDWCGVPHIVLGFYKPESAFALPFDEVGNYPNAFGWRACLGRKYVDGRLVYGGGNRFYRPYFGAEYHHNQVERLWKAWLAAAKEAPNA